MQTHDNERDRRFEKVFNAALELFEGDDQAARQWFEKPVRGLGHVSPASMLETDEDAEVVLTLINRLENGIVS